MRCKVNERNRERNCAMGRLKRKCFIVLLIVALSFVVWRTIVTTGVRDTNLSGARDKNLSGGRDKNLSGERDKNLSGERDKNLSGGRDKTLSGGRDKNLSGERDNNLSGGRDKNMNRLLLDTSQLYFEPEVTDDFPTTDGGRPKIPHILHQTYKTEFILESSVPLIQSFVKFNPNWTYFFWTDQTARKFLEDKYKYFLPIYDGYKQNIYRADALRYFVLYEYGGVYADIDFEFLRPLDRVTMKYPAIFPVEPIEHCTFRLGIPYLINNAIMMSRPKHPFLKQMMDKLYLSINKTFIIDVAGPWFVTDQYREYYNISNEETGNMVADTQGAQEPYFYKGNAKVNGDDIVYVPNTHYFMNTLADNFDVTYVRRLCQSWISRNYARCSQQNTSPMCREPTIVEKRACNELARRDARSPEKHFKFTFTRHHWFSTYYNTKIQLYKTVDVRAIVPSVIFYS